MLDSFQPIYTEIRSKVCDFFRESDCRKTAFSRAFFLLCIFEPKTLHWKARSERKTRPLQTLDLPFLVPCQLCLKSQTVQCVFRPFSAIWLRLTYLLFELQKSTVLPYIYNRLSRRKRGMASNPLFIIPDFFFAFSQWTLLWLP